MEGVYKCGVLNMYLYSKRDVLNRQYVGIVLKVLLGLKDMQVCVKGVSLSHIANNGFTFWVFILL